jgi:hypothetical protein
MGLCGGGPLVGASLPAQAVGAQVASGYTPGDTFSCCCSGVSFSPSTFLCIAASWAVVDKNIHTTGAKQLFTHFFFSQKLKFKNKHVPM